jgi:hypothetical protein
MGARAQLASCLVCFDLARQGDEMAQREFAALAPTMAELALDPTLAWDLLANDPYLESTWGACKDALAAADSRHDSAALAADVEMVGELDLLSEEELDLGDILEAHLGEQAESEERARQEYGALLAQALGQDPENGSYSGTGFATSSGRDLDRLEAFLRDAASHAPHVPPAAGMASLGQLFLATHLRARTFFGKVNPRRRAALREGLRALPADAMPAAMAAAAFELAGGHTRLGFEKVLELLLDFLAFCRKQRLEPRSAAAVTAYIDAEREPPPVLLNAGSQRRRRS